MLATMDIFYFNKRFFYAFDSLNKREPYKMTLANHNITTPFVINYLIENRIVKAKALNLDSDWFSIKYHPERILAIYKIADKIRQRLYPNSLGHSKPTQKK